MRKLMLALVGACAAAVGFADSTSAEILAKLGSSTNPDKVEGIDLGNNMYAIRFAGAQTSTFTFSSKCTVVEALVVGGGGAGGGNCGGGGGGGGLIHLEDLSSEYEMGTSLSLAVGKGGAADGQNRGNNGSDSFLVLSETTYTAPGGGGGGTWNSKAGKTGGCGGGGCASGNSGGASTMPSETGYYGMAGAAGFGSDGGGGGGGAGGAGETGNDGGASKCNGGNGGAGLPLSITGTEVYYAAGGGGGSGWSNNALSEGGIGGGGAGGGSRDKAEAGKNATGYGCGGGGAGSGNGAGAGSDGVVILVVVLSGETAEFNILVSSNVAAYDAWTASLMFIGIDEDSAPAQAYLTLSKNSDGSNPVIDRQAFGAAQSEAYKAFSATVSGLEPSTHYYAVVTAGNNAGDEATADVIEFTTLTPTAPSGSFKLITLGRDFQTFEATLADFGNGSTNAVLTMELSTTEGFDEIAASESVTIDATGAATLTVSGLESGVLYYSRLKIDNSWHIPYETAAQSYATRLQVECAGIGYTTSDTGFDVSVAISYVSVENATVTLFADGVQIGEAQAVTVAGNYPFVVTTDANAVALKAVVAYGATVKEFAITATKGTSSRVVGDVADYASAATALRMHVGDVAILPALPNAGASYLVLNPRFASISESSGAQVLTALAPGIVGIEYADGTSTTTMGVIVLPDRIGDGDIYLFNKDAQGGTVWNDASNWEKLGSETNDSWPHNPDDIAIFPFYSCSGGVQVRLNNGCCVTNGAIYTGSMTAGKTITITLESKDSQAVGRYVFARTDGQPSSIQISQNDRNGKTFTIQFGGYTTEFEYLNDTVFDGGWDGANSTYNRGRPSYAANCTNEIPAGATLTWRNIDSTGGNTAQTFTPPLLVGGGTVWNRSAAKIWYKDRNYNDFTGVLRDSGYGSEGAWLSMPMRLVTGTISNATVEVCGFVGNSGGSPSVDITKAAGLLSTGGDHPNSAPAKHSESWFPKKGLKMVNGAYQCNQVENPNWGSGLAELKQTDNFTIGQGFSAVIPQGDLRSTANGHPINWFETADLTHLNKGTLRFDDLDSKHQNNPASPMHSVTILHGYDKYAVGGGTDDPKTGPSYPIVPWLVGQSKKSNDSINFVCVDGNDTVCGVSFNNTGVEPKNVTDPNQNVFAWSKSLALTESKTFNSLTLCSNGNSTKMGADKTLTLTSGGLILTYGGSKHSSIGTQTGGADNGALILGDETHPGYVFACSTSATAPCGIWAPTTAPGGLVFGYTGYALLAGDQTGVDDELVVNAGTLDLGSQDKSVACTLDVPVRVLANATVKLNNVSMRLSDIYLDDIAGYGGRIELNAAETKCRKLYVRDTPEATEWTSLPAGTYGATGSGAQFIDDTRFRGAGVLTVRTDDISSGLMIFLR